MKSLKVFKTWIIGSLFLFQAVNGQGLYFPPTIGNTWDTIAPIDLGYCQSRIDSLYQFLENQNTKAFILLKDGKIVLEKYFGTHTASSLWQWASAGKTITSFLVGIAQQEGHLSITDTTSQYLGQGWTSCTPAQEEKITIWHQLTMTSGLDDGVSDPYCTTDTCLIYKADAGTRWAYHNAPYTLLANLIETATGISLNAYATQKLKNPTGMSGLFIKVGFNNVYFSNARSMARFGLLILNRGIWNGNVLLSDTAYFNQMVNTSQQLNKAYGYLWWLNGKSSFMVPSSQIVFPGSLFPNAPADLIVAIGKGGQFLNIVPSQNLVWLRMGDEPNNLLVPSALNKDIWDYINNLDCSSTYRDEQHSFATRNEVLLYPNPSEDEIVLQTNSIIETVQIFNLQGQLLLSTHPHATQTVCSINKLPKGLYFVKVFLSNQTTWFSKFTKF